MKILYSIFLIVILLSSTLTANPLLFNSQNFAFAENRGTDKILICHVPPGNPENAHPITISEKALDAHLAHGDTIGNCPQLLAEEYIELIGKINDFGVSLAELEINQEIIDEINLDLLRIKEIVIELQTLGFDGEANAEIISGHAVGTVSFFNKSTLEVLFEIQIPDGALAIFSAFGLIEEFEGTNGAFTLDEKIALLRDSLIVVNIIANFEDEKIATDFVLAGIGAYHPSTGETFVIIPILIRLAWLACLETGACAIAIENLAVFVTGIIIDEKFPNVAIVAFKFDDKDGDGEFEPENNEVGIGGFDFTIKGTLPILRFSDTETSESNGQVIFQQRIPRMDNTFVIREIVPEGWIPTTQEDDFQLISIDFTSDAIIFTPPALLFGNQREVSGSGLDIVIGNESVLPTVEVLFNDGSGSFGSITEISGSAFVRDIAIADFNDDGFDDIVTANNLASRVTVILGDGMGGFHPAKLFSTIAPSSGSGARPTSVDVADFDNDGKIDIITGNVASESVSVLRNTTPSGEIVPSFARARESQITPAPDANVNDIVAADFNNDGNMDAVLPDANTNQIFILVGRGDSSLLRGTLNDFSVSTVSTSSPRAVAVADFDADGLKDVAVALQNLNSVSFMKNNGLVDPTSFVFLNFTREDVSSIGSGAGPRSIEILEGGAFVVTANFDSDDISVLQSTGSGFTPISTISVGGDGPIDLAVGDLNGDGSQDVVTANFFSNNVSVLFGNGGGGFSSPNIISIGSVIEPRAVSIGNFDAGT